MDPFVKLGQMMKGAADLTAAGRKHIKETNFAIPEEKKYPIHDMAHARNALARVSQHGTPEERRRVREAVYRKYPSLREEFEERHGVSPLSKKVVTKKKIGDVTATSKAASLMAEAIVAAMNMSAELPESAAGPAIKVAAADLLEAIDLGTHLEDA